jgi:hypothetical protein
MEDGAIAQVPDLVLSIGQVRLALVAGRHKWSFEPGSAYPLFASTEPERESDVRLSVFTDSEYPPVDLGVEVFAARHAPEQREPSWSLHRQADGRWAIVVNVDSASAFRQRVALLEPDLSYGDLILYPKEFPSLTFPLLAPLDRVLVLTLLTRLRGIMLHACGIDDAGQGIVFAGPSDAGKTTLAHLWNQVPGVRVLGDEAVVLREVGGEYRVYGTPWPGEAGLADPGGVPLRRVFFVQHADGNRVRALEQSLKVRKLLAQTILLPYDREGSERIIDFCISIAEAVPAAELGFVPNDTIADFVRGIDL